MISQLFRTDPEDHAKVSPLTNVALRVGDVFHVAFVNAVGCVTVEIVASTKRIAVLLIPRQTAQDSHLKLRIVALDDDTTFEPRPEYALHSTIARQVLQIRFP